MNHGGPSVMESYQTPSSIASGQSTGHGDYPGESVIGDTTVQGRDYRPRSVEYISNRDSGGGTVVGYVSTGYRSDASHGVPDVDFDDKQAYESIEKFQDPRVKQNNGAYPSTIPPQVGIHPGKFEMPDYVTKKGWLSLRRCLCFFIILSVVTLFVSVAGAAIGVYAFLSVFEGGRLLGSTPIEGNQTVTLALLQEQLAESNMVINELRTNLSSVNENHQTNFEDLTRQLAVILNVPTTTENSTDTPNPPSFNTSVNLYSQCKTRSFGTCMLEAGNLVENAMPQFSSCETPVVSVNQPGMVNLDIHCGVANRLGERNPITASLNLYDGEVSCACYLVATQTPLRDVECTLYITRCPGVFDPPSTS